MAQSTQCVIPRAVRFPNHTFSGQTQASKRLTSIVHISAEKYQYACILIGFRMRECILFACIFCKFHFA